MSFKVKLLRKLTKKPYGLAKFRVGRSLYSKIVNFAKDQCEWMGGTYQFERGAITIEKPAGKGIKGQKNIYNEKDWANYEEGFPIVIFDVNSAKPLRYEGDPQSADMPTSKAIQSTMKKELAAFEAELMRKQRSKLMQAILITLIFSMVSMMLSIYLLIKTNTMSDSLTAISMQIENAKLAILSGAGAP